MFYLFFQLLFLFEYLSHSLGSLDSFETLITSNLWTCTSFDFYLKFWVLLVAEIKSSPNHDDQPWSVSGWIVAYISVTYIQLKLFRVVIMITFFYILNMSISQQQKKSRNTLNLMKKILGSSENYSGIFFNRKNYKDYPNFSIGIFISTSMGKIVQLYFIYLDKISKRS